MNTVRAKKSFGQHFLKDKNIANKIVHALHVPSETTIIEIGPGTGVLTGTLLDKYQGHFFAVEIDKESIEYLRNTFPALNLIEENFLKMDLRKTGNPPYCFIGNLPYNISSQIFFKLLDCRHEVKEAVFMIQKEVAERIASPAGNKSYGILSVLLQAYFDIEYLFTVKPQVFIPPPKVNSGVVRLKRNNVESLNCNEQLFFELVKQGFNQRRKTLRNALKSKIPVGFEDKLLNLRAEQLEVIKFVELTQAIESHQ